MKLTEQKLKVLVTHIVNELLKEFSLLDKPASSLDNGQSNDAQIQDPNNSLAGAMSNSDKMKLDKIKKDQRIAQIKQQENELKTAKKEKDFQTQKVDQVKKFQIPNLQKSIQQLKATH